LPHALSRFKIAQIKDISAEEEAMNTRLNLVAMLSTISVVTMACGELRAQPAGQCSAHPNGEIIRIIDYDLPSNSNLLCMESKAIVDNVDYPATTHSPKCGLDSDAVQKARDRDEVIAASSAASGAFAIYLSAGNPLYPSGEGHLP
jgi:hypothetical protein